MTPPPSPPHPPRLAARLLRRALPEELRDAVEGDLRELWARRRGASGAARAGLWYWREALALAARFAAERLRERVRETAGHAVGRDRVPSALDFRLGVRMLLKYPGLSVVGGVGMAVATAIGAGSFAFFNTYMYPDLPLHEGERVVSIVNWNAERSNANPRLLHDLAAWRGGAPSLVDVGAFRTSRRNLIDDAGAGSPVGVAEMSAAGFRVARVAPLVGRYLVEEDERPGAPPVIVIGHDVWTERLRGDPGIVGRTVRLGRTAHTIVGVMPAGFAFPVNHSYWVPLRADPDAYPVGQGPELQAFARLAPGATRERAQAELAVIGRRMAAAHPETHARLVPRVVDYADVFAGTGGGAWTIAIVQTVLAMLLVLVALNVAVLVHARTVTRAGEIAVRTALGATRGRIVTQLFAEALVLSLLSALAGLGLVAAALGFLDDVLDAYVGGAPFWVRPGLSSGTVLYTLGLAVLGAVIVGVLPALRATRARLRSALSALSGGSRPALGRTWTAMIVAQVAVAVAALPPAAVLGGQWLRQGMAEPGFPSEEFLSASLIVEREGNAFSDADLSTPGFREAMAASQAVLAERLERDPQVAGVTFGVDVPGDHEQNFAGTDDAISLRLPTRVTRVAPGFLEVFGVRVAAGRAFTRADVASPAARPVIVNRTFADRMQGRGSVVGRRVRFPLWGDAGWGDTARAEWREIVGVVEDFPNRDIGIDDPAMTRAVLYEPMAPGEAQGVTLFVRTRGRADAFAGQLRTIAAAADPALQLRRVQTLETAYALMRRNVYVASLALALIVGSVLLLSAAGMYALMSFTVSQRRREIGVRIALGADGRRILSGVLSRAARQLALGVAAGLVLVYAADRLASGGELMSRTGMLLIPGTALFMVTIGLLAALGPARRGLGIQPTEALKSE